VIEKGGEVIPKVTKVVLEKRLPNAIEFKFKFKNTNSINSKVIPSYWLEYDISRIMSMRFEKPDFKTRR